MTYANFADHRISFTALIQQLKLHRLVQDRDANLFAIAPNIDIAASVFTTAMRAPIGEARMLQIAEVTKDLPDDKVRDLPQLLEFGPIGVVRFDPSTGLLRTQRKAPCLELAFRFEASLLRSRW